MKARGYDGKLAEFSLYAVENTVFSIMLMVLMDCKDGKIDHDVAADILSVSIRCAMTGMGAYVADTILHHGDPKTTADRIGTQSSEAYNQHAERLLNYYETFFKTKETKNERTRKARS